MEYWSRWVVQKGVLPQSKLRMHNERQEFMERSSYVEIEYMSS